MKASDESKSLSLTVTKINFIANIKGNHKFVKMRKKLPYFRQIIVRTFLVPLKLTQISLKQLTKNKKKTKKEKRGEKSRGRLSLLPPLCICNDLCKCHILTEKMRLFGEKNFA